MYVSLCTSFNWLLIFIFFSLHAIKQDVRDDVQGAQKAGMKGILVQTGKYRSGDESKIDPVPDMVVNSFSDAIDAILNGLKDSNLNQE